MRYNPLHEITGAIASVKLAVSAASDYRERAERRRRKLAMSSR